MIEIKNIDKSKPFKIFTEKYQKALKANQKNLEAICVSSYDSFNKSVDSRYVNLKFIEKDSFIFFSNYLSPKSDQFSSHNQISICIFWNSINSQIRMKGVVKKTSNLFNQQYFLKRSLNKNALAISSKQSKIISSYKEVVNNFNRVLDQNNLSKCPKYWGGYNFKPFEIEFWTGHEFRLNKRDLYKKNKNGWSHFILEP